jgi:hypothetical protein
LEQSAFQAEHGKMKDYITDVWEKGASGQKPDGSPRTNNPDAFDGKTSEISRQVERAEMLASPEKRALAISEKLYGSDAPKTLPEAEEQFVKMGFNKNDPDLKKALETKFSPEKNNGAVATETSGSRLDKPAAEKRLEDLGGEQMGITERQGYKGLKGNVYKLPDEEAKRIQEVILNDPNLSPKIKDIIRAYSPKSLRFTYDLVGHGNSTFKIFGLSGKDANRLGSYDSNFKYTRL